MIDMFSWPITVLLLLITSVILSYGYMTRHFNYWKERGIPYIKPIPFFGNFWEIATFKMSAAQGLKKLYDRLEGPFVGIFIFDTPVLMLKSPKLIHDVIVKDVATFRNRSTLVPDHKKVNSNFLFFQRDATWKQTRMKMNALFTPVKMKKMFSSIEDRTKVLSQLASTNLSLDLKDTATKYLSDIIAGCFFEITTDCMVNKKSDFLNNVKRIFNFTWRNAIVHSIYMLKPDLINLLKLSWVQDAVINYYKNLLQDVLRNKNLVEGKSQDFAGVVKEMQQQKETEDRKVFNAEIDELLVRTMSAVIAGIDTTSAMLAYTLYEMTLNNEIQEKARSEAKEIIKKHKEISYTSIQDAKYLEMCILESIRKYPVLPFIDREASESYTFADTNLTIDKGTRVYIPLYPLQMDEKYFPNSTKYNPDRFLTYKKNEGELNFLPFGGGLRICVGERLVIMILKTAILNLLLKFKLEKVSSSPEKIDFEIKSFLLLPKTALNVKFKPLEN